MSGNPATGVRFDPAVAGQLACPVCYGTLRHDDPLLVCVACGRTYPIVDGIPMLVANRVDDNN